MADVLDLYAVDYDRFIEHCIECSGTLAIKQFLEGKIKKYLVANEDMIICMMERIEKNYPDSTRYDLEEDFPFYNKEISNFALDSPNDKTASLKYLYSYLCFLNHYDNEIEKIAGLAKNSAGDKSIRNRLTFGIDKRHAESLLELTTRLNAHVDFLKDREGMDTAKLFVDILLADNLNALDREKYKIYFGCKPGVLALILRNLIDDYKLNELLVVIQNSGLFFDYKNKQIKRGSVDTAMSRLGMKASNESQRRVNRIFTECRASK